MSSIDIILFILIGIGVAIVLIFIITSLTGAPYVPTLHQDLDKKLNQLYPFTAEDLLIDLGSGDGEILKIAASKKSRAIGIELNPILVLISKIRFRKQPLINIYCRNLYHFHFPAETTIIYTFAVSIRINSIYNKIQKEANRLDKTLYFISNGFRVGRRKAIKHIGSFYLYKISPSSSK